MSNEDTLRRYLIATNELLLQFAREAKRKAVAVRGTEREAFQAGYLNGFYRTFTLMQQQAMAYGIELSEVGLDGLDAERELI